MIFAHSCSVIFTGQIYKYVLSFNRKHMHIGQQGCQISKTLLMDIFVWTYSAHITIHIYIIHTDALILSFWICDMTTILRIHHLLNKILQKVAQLQYGMTQMFPARLWPFQVCSMHHEKKIKSHAVSVLWNVHLFANISDVKFYCWCFFCFNNAWDGCMGFRNAKTRGTYPCWSQQTNVTYWNRTMSLLLPKLKHNYPAERQPRPKCWPFLCDSAHFFTFCPYFRLFVLKLNNVFPYTFQWPWLNLSVISQVPHNRTSP